ncbi:MAG: glycosyltransferase [Chitinivibrionia bacterium]|nr:glycosyltransferase [Chitinivibrionia bacterium]
MKPRIEPKKAPESAGIGFAASILQAAYMQKSVLFITYHYPPILSAGVSRLVGLTKYLARAGWRCTVVTVARSYAEERDDASLGRIPPGVTVIRTGTLEADRFNPRRMLNGKARGETAGRAGLPGRKLLVELTRYPYAAFHMLASYPERQAGWCVPLFIALRRIMSAGRYDVVVSSSPPHSTHIAVWSLRKVRRFRWIVDFRDPWSAPPHYGKASRLGWLTRKIEGMILRACDRVVANTPGNKASLLAAFPFLDEGTVAVVTNGYDVEESGEACRMDPGEVECDLLYTGEIYRGMLDLYIEALIILQGAGTTPLPRLFVYGAMDGISLEAVRRANLEEFIVFKGAVTLSKSTTLMRAAPALLLTVPHNKRGGSWVPSKLYAYLFAGRPILAIVPEGDAAGIIRAAGAGAAVTSSDPRVVAEGMAGFLSAVAAGTMTGGGREAAIEQFTMESIAAQMESVLSDALKTES